MSRIFFWSGLIFILWFIPWVWCFYAGAIVYFPYKPDGKERYMRVTGPLLDVVKHDNEWVSFEEIPQTCKWAVVAAEDINFYQHSGVDLDSIQSAIKRNEKHKNIRFGASTITQQLVKNAFLSRKKSYVRKTREILGALILDAMMPKSQQLTWYFNVIEFGPSIYGIKAAAHYYFQKKPQKLTQEECVSLVSLLPSPKRFGHYVKSRAYAQVLERRKEQIRRTMKQISVGSKSKLEKAQAGL